MLLTIDPHEPEPWLIARVVQALKRGGLAVIPTDTVYAIVCPLGNDEAIERMYAVKHFSPSKRLSILVANIASASRFTRGISNHVFRAMKRVLPGPYTFIFQASADVPRIMLHKRRTVGLRIPDCPIALAVLAELGEPLLSTSVRNAADEWLLDPIEIEAELHGEVDVVADGGIVTNDVSTVVDLSGPEVELVRAGKGDVDALGLFE
jgi:tRNA threonylcarbamoyl adenosine modification protein (Sua5/YciO/YrdC/YwlC family)